MRSVKKIKFKSSLKKSVTLLSNKFSAINEMSLVVELFKIVQCLCMCINFCDCRVTIM